MPVHGLAVQEPQWFVFVDRSVHVPLQQAGLAPKHGRLKQDPQWFTSVVVLMHFPLQQDSVGRHCRWW